MDIPRPASYDVSDYLGMVRRHWWIVLAFLLAGAVGATLGARTQPKVYESTASVLVSPVGSQDANASGGRTNAAINLDTEAQLVTSTDVATAAGGALKVSTPPATLAGNVRVSVPANTTVLNITYSAGTAAAAQSGAHAFAIAYLAARGNAAQAEVTAELTTLTTKLTQYQASLNQLSGRLATMPVNDPNRASVSSQINTLTTQINALTTRQNELTTTAVTPGRIISDAALPGSPARPSIPLFAASGALLGLLLGVAVAALRQRTDRRVRRGVDLARRADMPVLGQLPPRTQIRLDDVFPPFGAAGRMFNRLRNEALASLRPGDQVIVVTGASRGAASTLVAANLAASLGRSGSEVVLICAHLPESLLDTAPATRLLGVRATPGLSDVLAGKVTLDEAVQRAPRNPWLRVLTTGGTASAGGLLQSPALRETLDRLRSDAEYVVVEAPSTAASADAQSLASLADAAIVAVELRRTSHAEVVDAAEQMRRVGTPVLGAVIMPRLQTDAENGPARTQHRQVRPLNTPAPRTAPSPSRAEAPTRPTATRSDAAGRGDIPGHPDASGRADTAGRPDGAGRSAVRSDASARAAERVDAPGRSAERTTTGADRPYTGTGQATATVAAERPADAPRAGRPVGPQPAGRATDETAVISRIDDAGHGDKAGR
jgi:Mrp family chromosome partitioning ATPase/capsular polysaccharide biosynthesis protein